MNHNILPKQLKSLSSFVSLSVGFLKEQIVLASLVSLLICECDKSNNRGAHFLNTRLFLTECSNIPVNFFDQIEFCIS